MRQQTRNILYSLSIVLFFLVSLLVWEYFQLRVQIEKIQRLKEQYAFYVESVRHVLKKQNGAFLDEIDKKYAQEAFQEEDDEMAIDSFIVINRSPSYLKKSTEAYLRNKQMDGLIETINPHSWNDYTQQVIQGVHEPFAKVQQQKAISKETKRTNQLYKAPTLKSKKSHKKPLTTILFTLPIERSKFWLSSCFGPRRNPNGQWGFHTGIDMAAHRGTNVKAAASGVVEQASYVAGYGNTIVIKHDDIYKTRYAHLDVIVVQVGQKVIKGDLVGKVGDTGFTRKSGKDASHLHLELYEKGKQINPLSLLPM